MSGPSWPAGSSPRPGSAASSRCRRPLLMRECAELRRLLGQVLAVLAERQDESRQLAEVRTVLAAFDWEFDDRQYALERIERIVTGGEQ